MTDPIPFDNIVFNSTIFPSEGECLVLWLLHSGTELRPYEIVKMSSGRIGRRQIYKMLNNLIKKDLVDRRDTAYGYSLYRLSSKGHYVVKVMKELMRPAPWQ